MRAYAVVHYCDLRMKYPNLLAASSNLFYGIPNYTTILSFVTHTSSTRYIPASRYTSKKEQGHDSAFYYRH